MKRPLVLVFALALMISACGGSEAEDLTTATTASPTASTAAPETTVPATTPSPTTTVPVADFDIADIEQSVVQIQAKGTFVTEDGQLARNTDSTGTGFIISEDGLVVTNNHVVTGAATIAVTFSGSDDEINARILGVSECSDLAVIQLAGDGYTPLQFREEDAAVGIEAHSAGFPASDEDENFDDLEYSLTSGTVGALDVDGESSWASVDGVIQHDAQIFGGNSGGPLVDEDGQVIAINYAGADGVESNFAITAQSARSVIDRLIAGEDVDSVGINGQAISNGGLTGIFIRSVESGSPADKGGIEPGDVLLTLENLVLATDGTMADYCDVLRTQGIDDTMAFEVYRPSLDLVLDGQLNGEPLEIPLIAQTVIESDSGLVSGEGSTGVVLDDAYTYVTVTDDEGLISVSLPTSWTEVDGAINASFGPSIWASPDIAGFQDTWDVPGIIVESSADFTSADIDSLIAGVDLTGTCEDLGTEPYEDALYAGVMQIWGSCGGTDTFYVVVAASPLDPSEDYLVQIAIQAVTPQDLEAADEALATFIADV